MQIVMIIIIIIITSCEFTTVMGNSPSSGQGGIETHDSRDIDGTEFKDERPYKITKLAAGKTKTSDIESSNSDPLQ